MEEARWMVWMGVQSGQKKCPKAFEEISSFVARWRPRWFLSRKKGIKKNRWRKREKIFLLLLNKLISSVKNQKDFWESVHKVSPKRKSYNISLYSWFKHFRALLQKEVDFDFDDENAVQDDENSLNRLISKEEVLLAFRK